MATILYPTATIHINKHPYAVWLPPYMLGVHREVEKGALFAPIYEAFDDKQPQRAKVSIAKMVEMFVSKTPFTIVEDREVLEIVHQIDAYVAEVYTLRTTAVESYLQKILGLRSRMYMLFRRVLNHHPNWKQAYIGDQGILGVIRDLYRPFGIDVSMPLTLLEELAVNPTMRAHPEIFNPAPKQARGPAVPSATAGVSYDV